MSDFFEIKKDTLNLEEITNLVIAPDCGAVSLFLGKTKIKIDASLDLFNMLN